MAEWFGIVLNRSESRVQIPHGTLQSNDSMERALQTAFSEFQKVLEERIDAKFSMLKYFIFLFAILVTYFHYRFLKAYSFF